MEIKAIDIDVHPSDEVYLRAMGPRAEQMAAYVGRERKTVSMDELADQYRARAATARRLPSWPNGTPRPGRQFASSPARLSAKSGCRSSADGSARSRQGRPAYKLAFSGGRRVSGQRCRDSEHGRPKAALDSEPSGQPRCSTSVLREQSVP